MSLLISNRQLFGRFVYPVASARNFQGASVYDRLRDFSSCAFVDQCNGCPRDFHFFPAFRLRKSAMINQPDTLKFIKPQYDCRTFLPVRFRKRTDSSCFNRSSHNPPNFFDLLPISGSIVIKYCREILTHLAVVQRFCMGFIVMEIH